MKGFVRKALGFIVAAATVIAGTIIPSSAADAKIVLPKTEAVAFVDSMGAGWNLGNSFDSSDCTWLSDKLDYESAWCGAKASKELIKSVKKAGFGTIRIPVSWHNHVDESYNIDSDWMERVKEVTDWSLAEGLKVIINVHHDVDKRYYYPDSEHLDNSKKYMKAVWTQIAKAFSDYGEDVVFETINEPRLKGTNEEWWYDTNNPSETVKDSLDCVNKLNQTSVDAIRAAGGKNKTRYIIVGGYDTNGQTCGIQSKYFVMPKDSTKGRLLADVHYYGYSEPDYKRVMGELYEKFVKNGIPVVFTEYGMGLNHVKYDNTELCVTRLTSFATWSRTYGMCPILWDNNNANGKDGDAERFKYIDRATGKIYYPELVKAFTKAAAPSGLKASASSEASDSTDKKTAVKVTAKAGSKKATISWNKIDGATKYKVYMLKNGKYTAVTSSTKKTSATIKDLKTGKTYKFALRAYVNGKWTTITKEYKVSVKVK